MTESDVKKYLIGFPEVKEDYPFGPESSVYKIENRMFVLLSFGKWKEYNSIARLNIKCDPDEALMLRDMLEEIIPGYHMNKKHWNTIILNGGIPEERIKKMINASFSLVVGKLTKSIRHGLVLRNGEAHIYR